MSGPIGNRLGYLKRELEAIALASKSGVDAQTLASLKARVDALDGTQRQLPTLPPTGIDNWLVNADFDHSVLSYTGAGANDEAYKWFRGVNPANPVKTAATNPLWNVAEGWLDWSVTTDADDLSYAFGKRLVRPGQSLFLMFNARTKDGAPGSGIGLEAGIWDATAGIDNWVAASLSGGPGIATITVIKVGPAAATTNYTYALVAQTDRNETIVSSPVTVLGAAALNSTDYNQLNWTLTSGILSYRIYRVSPNPGLVGIVESGATSFNDTGVLMQANAPIPAPTVAQARILVNEFGLRLTPVWQTVRATIRVPRNYNFSLTGSDKQWLRIGLRGTSSSVVQVDRFGLSLSAGLWAPSPEDRLAVSDTIITPTGDGEQSGVGVDYSGQGYGFWDLGRYNLGDRID